MNKKNTAPAVNYRSTMTACFIGYIVQAIVNNFAPLLFLTFHSQYQLPLSQITFLVTINFGLQLLVDLVAVVFVDRIGYRISLLLAHGCVAAGFVLLAWLPEILSSPFLGLLIAVSVYAVGGGLLEVLVSPVVESCPTPNKETAMSLLHSFYCWGQVGVVLGSTVFFQIFGISSWRILACIWAIVPFLNGLLITGIPLVPPKEEKTGTGTALKGLLHNKLFWSCVLLMFCAGACELSVSQWASTFAEKGLGISKTLGDLLGPMLFALTMGTARAVYGKYGEKINLEHFMRLSGILCVISYLMIALIPIPALSLASCAICGMSVGILWPGTFSIAAAGVKGGGTAMFALLALAGDLGCSAGPTLVGLVSGAFQDNLSIGILAAVVFPVLLLVGLAAKKAQTADS